MSKRVKLVDIAREAGVSKMAVSLALRDDPSIGMDTKQRVQAIAKELNYIPNKIARGLASGTTYTITAMVGGALHDDYHNRFFKGAVEHAIERGYTLTIGLTEGDAELEKRTITNFQQMMVDGYLVFHSGNPDTWQDMKSKDIPFVFYTKYFENLDCDCVVCDDVQGGYLMTKHFLNYGHECIAFVYDKGLSDSSEVKNRIMGYRMALEESGIAFDKSLLLPYVFSFDRDNFAPNNLQLVECLNSKNRPTAIFVCNDVVASAFYIAVKAMGLRIPEDVSIGGYEGVYLGAILDPPLTTVSTPIERMGREACKLLLDRIEKRMSDEAPQKILLEPRLTIRNSTMRR